MAGEVQRQFQNTYGVKKWGNRVEAIDAMWNGLQKKILDLPLAWTNVRIYQDGLPVCQKEKEMVHDLAERGSRNHLLLVELMNRGAVLMGTENATYLVREYRRIQELINAANHGASDSRVVELKTDGETLLRERDTFIAKRIESTLQEGETGILFIGLYHHVDEYISNEIDVRHLIYSLPFRAEPWRQV